VRYAPAACAECGQPVVVDDEADEARLVCMDCLLKDAPPLEPRPPLGPHPFLHTEHCADCLAFAPYRRKYDAKPWNGSW
jgi:NMD protein affecting ribosome stability and mRNA decay